MRYLLAFLVLILSCLWAAADTWEEAKKQYSLGNFQEAYALYAKIAAGSEILLQATASGAKDIILLELSVDGALVESSSDPVGTSSLTVRKRWVVCYAIFRARGTIERV